MWISADSTIVSHVPPEPTNHLDSAAIRWLGQFLKSSSGTFIIVSHDEQLLQDSCNYIVEVRGKRLHHFPGTYSKFIEQRKERDSQQAALASAQADEIARLQSFVDRFGAKASKATQAQSRVKLIEKLEAQRVDAPVASSEAGPGDAKKVTLKLPRAPACHQEVLVMTKADVGWGSKKEDGTSQPLISDMTFNVKRGQRVLVLGPNGAGKSTLIKAIHGSIPLWGGARKMGDGVRISYFSQDLAQDLPLDMTALEYVESVAQREDPLFKTEKCRQALGALGLRDSMALTRIGVLSGGEKARVALAAFALVPCNFLLLDEASNHLDAATINVLTGALQEFEGAIVAITHNPSFAESLNATHILRVQNGVAKMSDKIGDLSDADFDHSPPKATAASKASSAGNSSSSSGKKSNPPSASAAKSNGKASPAAAVASSSPTKGKKLNNKEMEEYKKLKVEVDDLTKKRHAAAKALNVAKGKEAEKKAVDLAMIQDQLDVKEVRWLELAEQAGDL